MDLLLMRSLLAVAEHGAITDAAVALGISQSALSRRIDQLEDTLGAPVLERMGRGITLTAIGRLALEEGKLLVQRYDRLKARVHEHLQLDAGVVRIGGGATAVGFLLPRAIAAFRVQHPGVALEEHAADLLDHAVEVDDLIDSGDRLNLLAKRPWVHCRILELLPAAGVNEYAAPYVQRAAGPFQRLSDVIKL